MDVERPRGTEPVLVPDAGHQVLPPDHAARVARELGEQVELLAGQLDLLPVELDPAGGDIYFQAVNMHDGVRAATPGATQHRPDARYHLRAAERLDHVVVRAQLEAYHAIHLGPSGRQHQDWDLGGPPQLAADVAAISVGKGQVEQHQVRLHAPRERQRLLGAARRYGLEAFASQGLRERLRDRRLVLHEEDPGRSGRPAPCIQPRRPPAAFQSLELAFVSPWADGAEDPTATSQQGDRRSMSKFKKRALAGATVAALGALAAVALASSPESSSSGANKAAQPV